MVFSPSLAPYLESRRPKNDKKPHQKAFPFSHSFFFSPIPFPSNNFLHPTRQPQSQPHTTERDYRTDKGVCVMAPPPNPPPPPSTVQSEVTSSYVTLLEKRLLELHPDHPLPVTPQDLGVPLPISFPPTHSLPVTSKNVPSYVLSLEAEQQARRKKDELEIWELRKVSFFLFFSVPLFDCPRPRHAATHIPAPVL